MRILRHFAGCYLLCSSFVSAQSTDHRERFNDLVKQGDLEGQLAVLSDWRSRDGNDSELYVAFFNHYARASRQEVLFIGKDLGPGNGPYLELHSKDSNEVPTGYLYGDNWYSPELLAKGFAYIDTGISMFPSRLDMRFGKIHMLGKSHDYERFTDEVVRTIRHGAEIAYDWTWGMNEPLEDAKAFMYNGVQAYVHELFDVGDDDLLPLMARISGEVLTHEPEHVESLSTLGAIAIMHEEIDRGLELFRRAEKLAPNDGIVLGNLAQALERSGDRHGAILYYERMTALGDEDAAAYARSRIRVLKE